MKTNQQIEKLRKRTAIAIQEMDTVIQLHESWKPAAFDGVIIRRMGKSYATHTFNVIRMSLRREVLIGLMRLWDQHSDSAGLPNIAKALRSEDAIGWLEAEREEDFREAPINVTTAARGKQKTELLRHFKNQRDSDAPKQRLILREQVQHALSLVEGGNGNFGDSPILIRLKKMRDKLLAHRDIRFLVKEEDQLLDQEIEDLYQRMLEIMKAVRLAVENASYDPSETAEHFGQFAHFFWDSVCGETHVTHPSYRYRETPSFTQIC